jgi:cellulose synthase/poly-beta-1,6-N-acetylglucosamine synthase-like glycosyltransferase
MLSTEAIKNLLVYLPVSVIGLWRWTYWIARKYAASLYEPMDQPWPTEVPKPTVSVVTPVYNEDPKLFEQAMQSWIRNGVHEIIAVIDKTNVHHIMDFERRYRATNSAFSSHCRLIVTPKPGKRAALCDGIEAAKGDVIALVDSDTFWEDNVLAKSLPYFLDANVGGVTVPQRIQNPDTTSNVLFDMLLWTRYREEVPFFMAVGKAFNCLSGRTAFYRREALLSDTHDNIHNLRHEFFLGTRGISGDDKRLTSLVLRQGWHLAYASGTTVYTSGLGKMRVFMKQRLRWTRNSWRSDLRAVGQGWVWKHPALGLFMVDRFIQPFLMLLGPLVFVYALINQLWLAAGIILVWWFASRFMRLYSYFKAYPRRIVYLPAWIAYTYVNAIVKVYALATLVEHSWATRGHSKSGKSIRKFATVAYGNLFVIVTLFLVYSFITFTKTQAATNIEAPRAVDTRTFNGQLDFSANSPQQPALPAGAILPSGIRTYIVRPGDSLASISKQVGMDLADLKKLNSLHTNHNLPVGTKLIYAAGGNSGN